MIRLAEVFKLNRTGLNVRRALGVLVVMGVPLIVLHAINQEVYSTLVAMQRLAGEIIGAVVAALFLLTVDDKTVLEVVIVILGTLAGSIRAVNYAFYCAAMAGMVLIADDLADPTDLAAEGRRVLFTFAGVGIAVVVAFLAGLLQKRTAAKAGPKAAPQAPVPEGQAG